MASEWLYSLTTGGWEGAEMCWKTMDNGLLMITVIMVGETFLINNH